MEPSQEQMEIARLLSGLKSASVPEVGEQAGPSFTSAHEQSKVSRKRKIPENPNGSGYDSGYDADDFRSSSPSSIKEKKICSEVSK